MVKPEEVDAKREQLQTPSKTTLFRPAMDALEKKNLDMEQECQNLKAEQQIIKDQLASILAILQKPAVPTVATSVATPVIHVQNKQQQSWKV